MTYRIAVLPTFEIAGVTHGGDFIRDNDGSLVILFGDPDEDYTRRALIVSRVVRLKRGAAYDTPDPEQEAFARRVVDVLNGS